MAEPRTGLAYFVEAQNSPEAVFGPAWNVFGFFVAPNITTWEQNAPPGSPVANSWHIVGSSPTGAWAGNAGKLARYENAAWLFVSPFTGMNVYRVDTTAPQNQGRWTYNATEAVWYPEFRWWTTVEHWTGQYRGKAGNIANTPKKLWRKVIETGAFPNATSSVVPYGGSLQIDLEYHVSHELVAASPSGFANQLPIPVPLGGLDTDIIFNALSFTLVSGIDMSSYAGSLCLEYVKDDEI